MHVTLLFCRTLQSKQFVFYNQGYAKRRFRKKAALFLHPCFSFAANKKDALCVLFSLSKKYYFNFYASCGSTHKIEFAKQIHKFREHVSRNLYKGRKNVPVGRGFSSVFARKRGFEREAARKTIVFRQPQKGRLMRPFFVISVFSSSDRAAYSSVFWCSSA